MRSTKALVNVNQLIRIEGDEPSLNWRYTLNQLLSGKLTSDELRHIAKDVATVLHWMERYKAFVGDEEKMLLDETLLIKVFEPAIRGHRIADGFHRVAAARLAGLTWIGAHVCEWFEDVL